MHKILIIEDNETMREGMQQIIEKMNMQTAGAANGKTGIEMFCNDHFDLVITDYKMENMSGLDVLQEIKNNATKITAIKSL